MKEPAKIEKVTDDALSRSIISSVIGILLCMVCLVGTTWAWYSLSVESGVSVTEGANFDFDVVVTKNLPETTENQVTPEEVQLQNGQYSLEENVEYTVTLTEKGGCTAEKGFCKVVVTKAGENGETTTYYAVDFTGEEPAESISFIVTGSGTLKLIPMLGTPADQTLIAASGITLEPLTLTAPLRTEKIPEEKITPAEDVTPTDGETGTPDETAEKQQQETPPAEEQQQQPVETPADPGTTEPEEKSEEVIGEQSQTKPETQVEPPVNTETTESVTVPETQTEQTETSKTTTQE